MRCLVTAGPTWEPLDQVRRLTNFSTGSLGGQLANHLAEAGHTVTLLLSETATWRSPLAAVRVEPFSTTESLAQRLEAQATKEEVVIFHAAAVSDFTGGQAFERTGDGRLVPLSAGKLSTRSGNLIVELHPTPKLLPRLRGWFPKAFVVGWKFETDGTRTEVLAHVVRQFAEAGNDLCVANGPAYGEGFGLVEPSGRHTPLPDRAALFAALLKNVTLAGHNFPLVTSLSAS